MKNTKERQNIFEKRNFYTIKDSGLVYLFSLIFSLVVGLVFSYVAMAIANGTGLKAPEGGDLFDVLSEKLWFLIPSMLLTQVVFLGVYFFYHKINKISFTATNVSFKKINPLTAVLSAAVGIGCVFGFIWLIEGCFGHMFESWKIDVNSPSIPIDNVGWLFVNLLLSGIIPPICEELVFRGMVFQGLREKFSPVISVVLCGLLFALMHQSVLQFIYPFILGCVLSTVMLHTGNLIYCMLIHIFNNCTTVLLTYLMQIGALKLSFNVQWWGWICAILVAGVTLGLLFVIWFFYLRKHKSVAVEKKGEANQTAPNLVGKLPLTLVIGMAMTVILIVINAL